MKKYLLLPIILLTCSIIVCSCALFRDQLDKRSGFSNYLEVTEDYIREGAWEEAGISLAKAMKAWERVKPYLQVDIDHDYVKEIETGFIRLGAYIETEAKPNSLTQILVLQDNWRNIGSM